MKKREIKKYSKDTVLGWASEVIKNHYNCEIKKISYIGGGYFEVPLKKMYRDQLLDAPAISYDGDVELRSLGWIKDMERPIWSIRSSVPVPFTLLSAVIEVKVKS